MYSTKKEDITDIFDVDILGEDTSHEEKSFADGVRRVVEAKPTEMLALKEFLRNKVITPKGYLTEVLRLIREVVPR